ncbi:hypothetical protein WHR41_01384 [Cladosporium halotolerans]|uniref:Uncharacterized protein n=1 Tax=Cladosporium halotolerans TaxID=1052096 RepID=A0AB34L4P6_9PEZI
MVVMVCPVAFESIGYKTYIVFAVINAFMVPSVYFFYPETAGRSLEEMDEIFHRVSGFKGAFDVVKVAREMPRRYGKHGELLISYNETEEARQVGERRRSSVAGQGVEVKRESMSGDGEKVEDVEAGRELK